MARRGRVELRRIEDRVSRQVCFSKRRSGLFKKAYELSVLCDAEVALLVFSPAGKLYEFSSVSSLEKTVDRYQKFMKAETYFDKHNKKEQNQEKGFACSETNSKLVEIAERFLETDFAKLNIGGLEQLENDLNDALKWTTSRKATMTVQRRIGENEAEGGEDDDIADRSAAADAAGSSRGNRGGHRPVWRRPL
ncbi:hypothetical protein OPV22_030003 [Ensete ventricosum]|uniref:MADS-box domain-containing protein n=1 Tax=Ensete ventricosum TaxID=4639 RepID=A0AAV8QCV7_ENSVE|nr:hypothetical protein OPV22_030003 [Ensete ventricosum]